MAVKTDHVELGVVDHVHGGPVGLDLLGSEDRDTEMCLNSSMVVVSMVKFDVIGFLSSSWLGH